MNIAEFAKLLRRKSISAARFKVDKYTEDIPNMLYECYRYQVEKRGHVLKRDEATIDHIRRAARWLLGASPKPGLFLYGEPGNGKTTLAKAIAQLIGILYDSPYMNERKGVVIIPASSLTEAARGEKQELLNRMKTTELLYIDDVGIEPASLKVWGNEVSPLVDLLYYRYDNQLFTIITSNLIGDEDIERRYGARIADRFIEMFDLIGFENKSYRPRLETIPTITAEEGDTKP